MLKSISLFISVIRFLPHIIAFNLSKRKKLLIEERNYWIKIIRNTNDYTFKNFIWLLRAVPEYRSVFYFRLGKKLSWPLTLLGTKRQLLFINTASNKVGAGLVIQHGHSTIIEAHEIGSNCQIWHNVTIGTNISHSGNKAIIGKNVKISAGAIVLGNITIGDNVTIGAGAVVVKSIPDNCVVVGNPAYIIKKDDLKVKIML